MRQKESEPRRERAKAGSTGINGEHAGERETIVRLQRREGREGTSIVSLKKQNK